MKAAIYNPYLDTLGGGERYTLAFAKALSDLGYICDIEWNNPTILGVLGKRFGMDLSKINVKANINRGEGYDLCFWVSDGSIPTLKSHCNLLHFQVPFSGVSGKSLLNKMKLFRIKRIICNSEFTKKTIDEEFGVKSSVIYPPVDVEQIYPSQKKENIILYIGRFSRLLQSKNQDFLIEAFKKFSREKIGKWKLILAGGVEVGVGSYVNKLQKMSKGFSVEIIESPNIEKIRRLYGKSKIYWSASGYGVDENKDPKKVEHFGITVVEAMAGGAIPFCYNAGGHKEIIDNGKNGFLWKTEKDLISSTVNLVKNHEVMSEISIKSVESAKQFSYEKFLSNINKLF